MWSHWSICSQQVSATRCPCILILILCWKWGRTRSSLLLFRLLRTWHLQDGTLSSGLLDFFNHFFLAVGSAWKLFLDQGLLRVDLLQLVTLEAFNLLLMLLIVSLCFLLGVVLEGWSTRKLVFDFGLLGVEFLLGLFNFALDNLLHLLVVVLGLLLDGVKFLNETLLSIRVLLSGLCHFLFLSSLLRRLAFPDKLHFVVVSFGLLLNVG